MKTTLLLPQPQVRRIDSRTGAQVLVVVSGPNHRFIHNYSRAGRLPILPSLSLLSENDINYHPLLRSYPQNASPFSLLQFLNAPQSIQTNRCCKIKDMLIISHKLLLPPYLHWSTQGATQSHPTQLYTSYLATSSFMDWVY
uniref:Uncharacterized protein n=1 Tax=Oryza brachyantha TaxID=4533 RepID=J3KVK6_ORYBR